MAFSKTIVADSVITRLIESQGIFQLANRAFDSMVRPGASSVDVPDLAVPIVKTAGTPLVDSDRKKAKADTTLVNVPLVGYAVPLADELLAQFESAGSLIREYLNSASLVLQEKFDSLVVSQAQTTTNASDFTGETLSWGDLLAIKKLMDTNKVPKSGRVLVIDANIEDEFFGIEELRDAMTFNTNYLESGEIGYVLGFRTFISGNVAPVSSKYSITAFYGPGVAFVLNRCGEVNSSWDTTNLQWVHDMVAHAGAKLFNSKFAVVKTKPDEE